MSRVSLCVEHNAPKYLSKPKKFSDFQFCQIDSLKYPKQFI